MGRKDALMKKFGGKKFHFMSGEKYKVTAQDIVKDMRFDGYNARITRERDSRTGKLYWAVWLGGRRKRRRR